MSAPLFDPFHDDLAARASDPLFVTYAAPRSSYLVDEAYHFDYYSPARAPRFTTDTGGELGLVLKQGPQLVASVGDFYQPPIIHRSYPQGVHYNYEPVAGLRGQATFAVYSSQVAIWDLVFENRAEAPASLSVYPWRPLRRERLR